MLRPRSALRRSSVAPCAAEATDAEWILAAVRAWRWRCTDHLEGEFSFVVWDAERGELFAARDHGGARPLFFSRIGDGVAVASAARLVHAVPGCAAGWNLLALAEDAADVDLTHANETAFAAVERVPGGFELQWRRGGAPRLSRWWAIPIFEQDSGVPFDEAAEELRRLIAEAVAERSDLSRGSVVMLSGGYDSTAIYAAGNWRLGTASESAPLRSVSFSHPPGDPGREDELIAAVTARWGAAPYFIEMDSVAAFEPSLTRARQRDEPFYHTYELWNRALALGCRAQGSQIALNGNGGDPWFSTSPVFLADLARQGRWIELRREWRALLGKMTWYGLFKTVIQPNLPRAVLPALSLLRGGRPLADPNLRALPAWISEELRRSPELQARRRVQYMRRQGEGHSAAERTWFLRSAFAERTTALVFSICQREGVELRTPLLDSRIVRFAATRPRWESNSNRQNKHLLRRSMRGLLPEEVIAPRSDRTGLPVSYLDRTLDALLEEAREAFGNGMLLAKLGVGDHRKLLDEINSFLAGQMNDRERAAALVAAVQAEWWLRSFASV
jgi:asparagine synthase (glutamine-hydrolysing)